MSRGDELFPTAGDDTALTESILSQLAAAGADVETLTPQDIDVFEDLTVMGQEATLEMAALAGIDEETHVLDLAAGLGVTARTLAAEYGSRVTGVDLSTGFCHAATELTRRVGLDDRVSFHAEHALDLPFEDDTFDVVFMQDLASDIEYKTALAAEAHRVLAPGGRLVVLEFVTGSVEPRLTQLPIARDGLSRSMASEETFLDVVRDAGFDVRHWLDTSIEAAEWYQTMIQQVQTGDLPAVLDAVVRDDLVPLCRTTYRNLDEDRARLYMGLFEA
ncbi:class I SAM-dependent methyltransferase [Haloarchaeobius amylolyticus]|uniref:class I SAM-dependent methyltransferase n=1 Tax=Haloarchaeobius amylolyticus TaxID=1198296 RepID=UPI00226E148E|nr:methyltransferase domain-containing protein [Haloarchaeobius amylolyticus]